MTAIIVSPHAEADLEDLNASIMAAAGDGIANSYCQRIVGTIQRLSAIPLAAGHPGPKLGDGLRCHPFGKYNIYLKYDVGSDTLYVVRILHGRRNITKRLIKA